MNTYLTVFGLPAHPLLVHATVVLVPLAALLVAAAAVWPWLRARAGWLTPVLALVALVLVPLTTHTGEQLEARVPHSSLVEKHARLADGLLPWMLGLTVAALLVTWVWRRSTTVTPAPPRPAAAGDNAASGTATGDAATGGSELAGDVLVRTRRAAPAAVRTPTGLVRAAIAMIAVVLAAGTLVEVVRIGDSGARAAWHGVPASPRTAGP